MLRIVPCKQRDAKAFVKEHHRHHRPSVSAVFCLAVVDGDDLVRGVAMVGRPVARRSDDGFTCEVTRVATDGARNACSMLLGACRRVAFAMGYARIITYTLPVEGGASLRACGWSNTGLTGVGDWTSRGGRHEPLGAVAGAKTRWVCEQGRPRRAIVWPKVEAVQSTLWGV